MLQLCTSGLNSAQVPMLCPGLVLQPSGKLVFRQFANSAKLREELQARHPAIAASPDFRDLGVRAAAGRTRLSPVSPARAALATGRFARVALLPTPFDRRCHVGAAAEGCRELAHSGRPLEQAMNLGVKALL